MTHHKLVIAEKPSVAQSIAAVLGANKRNDGYLSGGGYLVSWCFGHLAELAGADVYDEKYAKWRYDDLPILPAGWRFTLKADKAKQFELLRDLMRREDVTEVNILLFQLWYSHAAPPRKCVHTLYHKDSSVFNTIPRIYRPKM